jgi:adenylate cyclase
VIHRLCPKLAVSDRTWRFDERCKSGYNPIMEENAIPEHAPIVYIPMDRRQALAHGYSLPDRTVGAALFADISGFTPLTEALAQALGPRRGADELTRHLNQVYDALIAEVDRYGGSVIGFAGDAITCWFADQDQSVLRATACALAMQRAMEQFKSVELSFGGAAALAMKAAVASGPARRFLVGDPDIQLIDALAGETLARMASGEHLADRGEVLADVHTVENLGERGRVIEWRTDVETGARFAVIGGLTHPVEPTPWPALEPTALQEAQVRPWLLPAVYERLREGLGEILLELREGVTLFLCFGGIDYEGDDAAEAKLDAFIRWVQGVLTRYEGSLLQLIIGDKGSYLYAVFGAPKAHEDDARRAAMAALELLTPPTDLDFIRPVQIGISQGLVRAGAYGGMTRRTYGVLSDEVNLAARLMQNAAPGEVLVSSRVRDSAAADFAWETLAPIRVKGKSGPVPVARLVGVGEAQVSVRSAAYTGELVGRETELAQLRQFLQPVFEGQFAGMAYVYGEAGVGKSRLVYEFCQCLTISSFQGEVTAMEGRVSWFTCPAEQILQQSLYPFKHFLRGYFNQHTDVQPEENKGEFDRVLDMLIVNLDAKPASSEIVRELERTRSFLGALVDLRWEGSLYEQLEPKLRFENTLVAFKTLVRAESRLRPVVLHVEDAHWLDADSHELLKVLVRNVEGDSFAVLLTGRYRDDGSRFSIDVDASVPQQVIDLNALSPKDTQALAAYVLEGAVADELASFLAEKTNGNPLFVEQLALDMRERELVGIEGGEWRLGSEGGEEVPASISAVMVARLDRLTARVKAAVQTAAVLGREFEVQVLSLMLRDDVQLAQRIKQAEAEMVWSALSEMRYIFRHTLMRDAAYDMQLRTRLQKLHTLAGEAMEQVYASDLDPHYADLAYHWGKAGDTVREFRYAKLAGDHAAAQFANQEAVAHFDQALRCAAYLEPDETVEQRQEIHAALGELLTTIGQYDRAFEQFGEARTLALERDDRDAQARACYGLARTYELRGEYSPALDWIQQGLDILEHQETAEAAELSLIAGLIYTRQGDYDSALAQCQSAMRLAQKLYKVTALAQACNLLGHITRLRGNSASAVQHFQQSLDLYQQVGDVRGQAVAHNQVANAYSDLAQWQEAEHHYHRAHEIFDQIGDVYNRAFADNNLGEIARTQGRLDEALSFYQHALYALEQIGGSLYVLGALHSNLGATYILRGEIDAAREHLRIGQECFEQAQARDWLPELHYHWAEAALHAGDLSEAESQGHRALNLARELEMRGEEGKSLRVLGEIATACGRFKQAQNYLQASRSLLSELGDEYEEARSLLALGQLYARQDEPEPGLAALEQCIPIFERLGAALDLDAAHRLRRELAGGESSF